MDRPNHSGGAVGRETQDHRTTKNLHCIVFCVKAMDFPVFVYSCARILHRSLKSKAVCYFKAHNRRVMHKVIVSALPWLILDTQHAVLPK